MPRRIRPIVPGVAHHVTQRAAHGRFILDSAHAKAVLADLITTWASKTGVVICGFVIMDNHFHLCAIPPDAHALSVMMGRVTAFFSKWLNLSAGDSGPNWQGNFFAAPMDDEHAVAALRYVERNPVAAGLVEQPWDWRWSSAAWHCGLGPRPAFLTGDLRPAGTTSRDWRVTLTSPLGDALVAAIRQSTHSNLPLGAEDWISAQESRVGHSLRPRARGRPRRPASSPAAAEIGTTVAGSI